MSVPGHALRCGPEPSVTSPCGSDEDFNRSTAFRGCFDIDPVVDAVVVISTARAGHGGLAQRRSCYCEAGLPVLVWQN